MRGQPRVQARLEQLRFEIDELSKRIDEHLEASRQYRAIHGFIDSNSTNEQSSAQATTEDSGETPR